MSKSDKCIIESSKMGYKILDDGTCVNPKGLVVTGVIRNGYRTFTLGHRTGIVRMHRLQAYQKFGNKIFENGVVVRHLNGNPMDNSLCNIEIGTQSDNMMDVSNEKRKEHAIKASSTIVKYNKMAVDIRDYYNKVHSYKKTMDMFGITSKSQLHYILHHEYVN